MGANLVAQQLDWAMTEGWGQGDRATNDFYRPIETFAERFGAFVDLVTSSGFDVVDVWTGQLHWEWATPAHFEIARTELERSGLVVASYAGYFGDTPEEFDTASAAARELGTTLLSGSTSLSNTDREAMVRVLKARGVRLAIENHGEKTPKEITDQIGTDGEGLIGTAVDTGWWGVQGFDAAEAVREFGAHVLHIHLKDVLTTGVHETCALGDGIVPIEDVVRAIGEIDFTGPISIEHEPEHYDPAPEIAISVERLDGWLNGIGR